MLNKILRILRFIHLKIWYRKKIIINGIPNIEKNAKIRVKKGVLAIGRALHMRSGSYIAIIDNGKITVEDEVFINRNCSLICRDSITIKTGCIFGPNCIVYDHDHKFGSSGVVNGYRSSPVVIEEGCWIGAGTIILRGTHIGKGSVIGAGCIIHGEIPPHSLVTSNRELKIVPLIDKE